MGGVITGIFALDWAMLSISLLNAILLFWLGLTVVLNAERRTGVIWLAGAALLLAGVFFVSHTAILGQGLDSVGQGMTFWWRVGWVPAMLLPLLWYLIILWYVGAWDVGSRSLARPHHFGLPLTVLAGVVVGGLWAFANPLPTYSEVAHLKLAIAPSIGGIPLLVWAYPLYMILCVGLSLDALRRPYRSSRLMGELARRRARPWLTLTNMALVFISLLVSSAMLWLVLSARQPALAISDGDIRMGIAWFDLLISALIAVAVVSMGQAIVAYEVFTGKMLPRRGLRRYWRTVILLGACYAGLLASSLTVAVPPIYVLLLSSILAPALYALFGWRAYAERSQFIQRLRPFVTSQTMYDRMLGPTTPEAPAVDRTYLLTALCEDVLDARCAHLVSVGPFSALVGPPVSYPPQQERVLLPPASEIAALARASETLCVSVDPARFGGASWAVPLGSDRGIIGCLLLGPKWGSELYSEEEIEVARSAGERALDILASAEMARRLMALQRQRLTETRLLDQRTRRVLHDDILPLLHAALLSMTRQDATATMAETADMLAEAHRRISDLLRDMPPGLGPIVAQRGLIAAMRVVVAEMQDGFDHVDWQITPEGESAARRISPVSAEVVCYAAREAIRNAAHHGRGSDPSRPLNLRIVVSCSHDLTIAIEDDGVGMGAESPGAGARQGLALHSATMAVIGGALEIESRPGAYSRVTLSLPSRASWPET